MFLVQKEAYFKSLPYEAYRVALDCGHSPLYIFNLGSRPVTGTTRVSAVSTGSDPKQPLLCGLCFMRDGFESEVPGKIHEYKLLAENGNPESAPKFVAHMNLVMGLLSPHRKEAMKGYRLARGQFSRPAWGLFPVTSALWKLMGNQPPLAIVLIRGVEGQTELQISKEIDDSFRNVHIRMSKALRTVMRYLPRDTGSTEAEKHGPGDSTGSDDRSDQEPVGADA